MSDTKTEKLFTKALTAARKGKGRALVFGSKLPSTKAAKDAKPEERQGAFCIHIDHEGVIKDNAHERFSTSYGDPDERAKFIKLGFIKDDDDGTISGEGWDQLVMDIYELEGNSLAWLAKTFSYAKDDGHDSLGDLVGRFWWSPTNRSQLETLEIGLRERIDMSDSGYGDLANSVWKGVSDFGQSVLGGAINFEKVDSDEVDDLLDALKKKKRK